MIVQLLRAVLVGSILVSCCLGYKHFQDELPNGGGVPHPCKPNYIWQGVGHKNVLGGGDRNPFGLAYKEAGSWTTALCEADSDGDGKTNGAELGDPSCTWAKGQAAITNLGLTHPGVCEPTDSADCIAKNSWEIDCSEGADFTCPGIEHPDTINMTLNFDRVLVPAEETTYMCQSFAIPADKEYHLFATKPEIDNAYVMHHTIVYGCDGAPFGYDTPKPCGMGSRECATGLGGWTVGSNGECVTSDSGFLIGKGHYTHVMIEHHWNNPTKKASYYDSSGMTLFITPNLRGNNMGILATGQMELTIPAGEVSYTLTGNCPGNCLEEKMKDSVYITSAHLHMHYLGDAGKIEHWRDGQLYDTWFSEDTYSYDSPITNQFDPPRELKKGDEIRTSCTFKSTSRAEVTSYGPGTSDEMCFGFMRYYPVEKGPDHCVSFGQKDACEIQDFDFGGSSALGPSPLLTGMTALIMLSIRWRL